MDTSYFKLTNRELEVMQILWQAVAPMAASDVLDAMLASGHMKKSAGIFTVQNLLKSLLEKGTVEVVSYVRVHKTTAREYIAKITADDYAVMQFNRYFPTKGDASTANIVSALLDKEENEADTIAELERILAERKMKLNEPDCNK